MIVRSLAIVTLIDLAPVLFAGCESPPSPTANAPAAPPAPPPPALVAPPETAADARSSDVSPDSTEPSADDRRSQPPQPDVPTEQPLIHLSAGVAVPQLLPDGTQLGVSVDYKINRGLKSSTYFLVIESSAGKFALPVKLSPMGGTLQDFLPPSVRPEHKPFRARIEEKPSTGHPMPASNAVELQTSY